MPKREMLDNARRLKNDEFYTGRRDIEGELGSYEPHFAGKVVLCNCDDPSWSEFFRYFFFNFEYLKLKELISTHFKYDGQPSYAIRYNGKRGGGGNGRSVLQGD